MVTSVVDVPEEVCDLNPSKVCRYTTRLVPSLTPTEQCTVVPKEGDCNWMLCTYRYDTTCDVIRTVQCKKGL